MDEWMGGLGCIFNPCTVIPENPSTYVSVAFATVGIVALVYLSSMGAAVRMW